LILNYFTYEVTHGVVEGKNNRTKVIERQVFSCRNFANLGRQRLESA
jgi:transposase